MKLCHLVRFTRSCHLTVNYDVYRMSLSLLLFFRELAFQISEQFEALGSSIGVKCGQYFYLQLIVIILHTYNPFWNKTLKKFLLGFLLVFTI